MDGQGFVEVMLHISAFLLNVVLLCRHLLKIILHVINILHQEHENFMRIPFIVFLPEIMVCLVFNSYD